MANAIKTGNVSDAKVALSDVAPAIAGSAYFMQPSFSLGHVRLHLSTIVSVRRPFIIN